MSRRFQVLLCGAILVAGLTAQALAAGFAIHEQSGQAMGTAGAFVAGQSAASIFYNPAGIAGLDGVQLEVGLNVIQPTTDFTGPTDSPTFGTVSMEDNLFTPVDAYASWRASDNVSFGLGLFTYMGLGTEWKENWVGREVTEEIFLETLTVNPTIAWRITDRTAFAVGLDLMYAMANLSKDSYSGYPFNGYVDVEIEGDGTGFGWNAGVQHQLNDDLRLGLSYRSGISLDAEGEATFAFENVSNPTHLALLGALFPTTDVSLTIEIPALTIAGFSWNPKNLLDGRLTWRGDLVYTHWAVYENLFIDFETETAGLQDSDSPKLYQNTMAFRTGVEYALNEAFTLRSGWYYEQNTVKDELVEPSLPDAERNGLSLGCSWDFADSWGVDAYYLQVMLQDRVSTFPDLPGGYESTLPIFGLTLRKSL